MKTWGFVPSYSDVAVNDQPFTISDTDTTPVLGAFLTVTGLAGDIVWENDKGEPQWFPGAQLHTPYIIGAARILSAATVRGTPRLTTATGIVWSAINKKYNTP